MPKTPSLLALDRGPSEPRGECSGEKGHTPSQPRGLPIAKPSMNSSSASRWKSAIASPTPYYAISKSRRASGIARVEFAVTRSICATNQIHAAQRKRRRFELKAHCCLADPLESHDDARPFWHRRRAGHGPVEIEAT
jgi:hypothetical protein